MIRDEFLFIMNCRILVIVEFDHLFVVKYLLEIVEKVVLERLADNATGYAAQVLKDFNDKVHKYLHRLLIDFFNLFIENT